MTQLTPALDAELRTDAPLAFGAVSIDLPSYSINLLDGAGLLAFGGRTFAGDDATFGVLSEIEALTDGTGDTAPALSISLLPAGDAAAATLSDPNMQGSAVSIWFGAVNQSTGQPIPDPHLIFLGELDVPTLTSTSDSRKISYEVVSVFERLFEDDESARLSPGFHRSIFPSEAGLDYVTGVDQPVFWGVAADPQGVTVGSSVGYGGLGAQLNDGGRYMLPMLTP